MNPHTSPQGSPLALVRSFLRHRNLAFKVAKMDVVSRYKGSFLGLGWSFFNPLLMLVVYTFVFSYVFNARWGGSATGSRTEFAVILFSGLLLHGFFAEILNRSPSLIANNKNYVKKVVFPLETLVMSALMAAAFHMAVSLAVLISALYLMNGFVLWTAIFLPLVILPLMAIGLGFGWMIASLGVYVRDVEQTIGILTTILLFLSPVFYAMSTLPLGFQWAMTLLNPLTFPIEHTRKLLIFGGLPDWYGLMIYWGVSLIVMSIGFWFFQKTRQGFADVL